MFIRAGSLVRVGADEQGRPTIEKMDDYTVRYEMARCIDWVRTKERRDRDGRVMIADTIVPPPLDVVRDYMRQPTGDFGLPAITGIIETPTMRPDGSVLDRKGFDRVTGLYYMPTPDLSIPRIPERPTPDQVAMAAELLQEVFCDFPFVDDASRANAIATIMTPVIRPMIQGPVPLALIDKPQQGTGASLIASCISQITIGRDPSIMTPPTDEADWRKEILTVLIAGRNVVVVDNLEGRLQSPSLAALLTSTVYEGRILGKSEQAIFPHTITWIGTGNNIELGGDIPRRCYWIRIDADAERPWQREIEFRHPDLRGWIRDVRGPILGAILILARAWIVAGRAVPDTLPKLGSFESWSEIIGGILAVAGIEGFLGNLDQLYDEADADTPEWSAFAAKWYDLWGTSAVSVAEIVQYLRDEAGHTNFDDQLISAVPGELMAAWNRQGNSFANKLGHALRRKAGSRLPGGYKIVKDRTAHKSAYWKIVKVSP
jgi:hypothetical protein